MGITGLLKALSGITENILIKDYSGKRVGIDGYCWLHRGVYTCAHDIGNCKPTRGYVKYFIKCVYTLVNAGVIPVVVFDGAYLPQKKGTEQEREKLSKWEKCK